ncbi:hypothetical protein GQ44DRAFT_732029 [Phaeosphaeriaceae sp. PMI808]|nr:hypothetical protein GQ44DRAFT_734223 [Phaeosphaeriaceae sp. PMI808]KAH8698026.1 hypothetical protein GQ44DRAFT_733454 [Phaeosphaeriaceae sp. PMI808]KAH8706992.1 hypothetical protein GQ44DRAFT_732029 [Phaeosphaeriaceae sp. PMI808]
MLCGSNIHQDAKSFRLFEKLLRQDLCLHQKARVDEAQQYYESVVQSKLLVLSKYPQAYGWRPDIQRQFDTFMESASIETTSCKRCDMEWPADNYVVNQDPDHGSQGYWSDDDQDRQPKSAILAEAQHGIDDRQPPISPISEVWRYFDDINMLDELSRGWPHEEPNLRIDDLDHELLHQMPYAVVLVELSAFTKELSKEETSLFI